MRLCSVFVVLAAAALTLASGTSSLSLGGVAVGASVLDTVKVLGTPDGVETTNDGHVWQWIESDGLDREVLTDDNLIVKSVLVAQVKPNSTAQPSELPVLGEAPAKAVEVIAAAGAVPVNATAAASARVWRLKGGVLIAESDADAVVRLRTFDERTALERGYLGPRPSVPEHRAPSLEQQFVPMNLPPGTGTVVVRVEVDASGKATAVRVVVASRNRAVNQFEADSMLRSTFRPATCAGTPCPGVYLDIGGMTR